MLTMEQNGFRASPKHRQKRCATGITGEAGFGRCRQSGSGTGSGGVHSCDHLLRQTTGVGRNQFWRFCGGCSQIELQKSLGRLWFRSITLWPQSIL